VSLLYESDLRIMEAVCLKAKLSNSSLMKCSLLPQGQNAWTVLLEARAVGNVFDECSEDRFIIFTD
jgi:hypothetical protein